MFDVVKPWMNYELWKGIEDKKRKDKEYKEERRFEYIEKMKSLGINIPENVEIVLEEDVKEKEEEGSIVIEGDEL